jgi:hypothetical protein
MIAFSWFEAQVRVMPLCDAAAAAAALYHSSSSGSIIS